MFRKCKHFFLIFVLIFLKTAEMALKMNRIHCLLACLLAAASCQIPESERVPSVFTVTFATPTPEPLQESVQVDIRCDLHWTAQLSDESWGVIEVLNIQEGQGGQLLLKRAPTWPSPRARTPSSSRPAKASSASPSPRKGWSTSSIHAPLPCRAPRPIRLRSVRPRPGLPG